MVFRLPVTLPRVVRDLVPGVVSGPDLDPAGLRVLVTGASGTFGTTPGAVTGSIALGGVVAGLRAAVPEASWGDILQADGSGAGWRGEEGRSFTGIPGRRSSGRAAQ